MNLKEWLAQGFDFELWADERWMESYPSMPEPRHAEEILGHMLWALETWLSRVNPEFTIQEQPFHNRLIAVCMGWEGDAFQPRLGGGGRL